MGKELKGLEVEPKAKTHRFTQNHTKKISKQDEKI